MFTREELEAMRLADEEIEQDFEETAEEIREAELRDGNLHYERNRDKWERERERRREYYRRNRDRVLAYGARYYQAHKEKAAAWKQDYYGKHKDRYRDQTKARKERYRKELPEAITHTLCQFWQDNRMSRDTFAKNVGVARSTAYQWGYRTSPPNIKKIRAVYPELADELERIMEGAHGAD